MLATFEQPFPEIQFAIQIDDFLRKSRHARAGRESDLCHDWNQSGVSEVKLQISRRDTPTLPTTLIRQQEQSYFKVLPFALAEIRSLDLNEIQAEKIRPCYRRVGAT